MITKKLLITARLSFYSIAMTLFKKNYDSQKKTLTHLHAFRTNTQKTDTMRPKCAQKNTERECD